MEHEQATPRPESEEIAHAIGELLDNGRCRDEVVYLLTQHGLPAESATDAVDRVIRRENEAYLRVARRHMLLGALWCVGGIGASVLSYKTAQHTGSHMVLWVGAIAVGLIEFGYGFKVMWEH